MYTIWEYVGKRYFPTKHTFNTIEEAREALKHFHYTSKIKNNKTRKWVK